MAGIYVKHAAVHVPVVNFHGIAIENIKKNGGVYCTGLKFVQAEVGVV